MSQYFECEISDDGLVLSLNGDLLNIEIDIEGSNEHPFIEIGPSQIANLIVFLVKVQGVLPGRTSQERAYVIDLMEDILQ
jgi:hypothetical protein